MKISTRQRAAFASFLRVLAAAALASYLQLGKAPLDLGLDDLRALANAAIAAGLLTAYNWLRPGETRFGHGSEDVGMGGDDELGPGGQVPSGWDLPEPVE